MMRFAGISSLKKNYFGSSFFDEEKGGLKQC